MAVFHVIVDTILCDSLNAGPKLHQIGSSVDDSFSMALPK